MSVFDARRCELGEGALWHPLREELFWFDILAGRLLSKTATGDETTRELGEMASAAGWIDQDSLLIASETTLSVLHLGSGAREVVAPLIPAGSGLRSNDGRADPWGGFWIGVMGKRAETGAGAILRYYRGELRRLRENMSIPNAICFDGLRRIVYFADTRAAVIWRQRLDIATGWPEAEAEVFLDLKAEGLHPDGAAIDAEGRMWNAQWGASRVACYDHDGRLVGEERFAASRLTCPAFGGAVLDKLYVTSAYEGLDAAGLAVEPEAGMTFARTLDARGMPDCVVSPG